MNRVLKEPKYYFVYYECETWEWMPHGTSSGNHKQTEQCVTDIHPLQWQLDCNEEWGKTRETTGGYKKREHYKVMSWQKLTVEEYNEFKDKVG
jgi:hypothetical protein